MSTKMQLLTLFALLFGLIVSGESASLTSVVQTEKGPIRGEILTTVLNKREFAAFKGIPYAEAPLKNLRFKPPVEKEAWTDVLNATSERNMCIQINATTKEVVGSEDCLYLNVFIPHTVFDESISKPVMVWIYGGAFQTGNSNASYFGPDFLLEEDVVVVLFNYRLGALGFLNLNHENATGNYGLKDQNLVLKWVQKNIAQFGGNPQNVTIFGQSAGAVAVDLHVLSDMSAGLFHQSISMSGSPLCLYWSFQRSAQAEEQAFKLGSKLGITTLSKDTLLEALYNATAIDIVNKTKDMHLLPFRPTIESESIAKNEEKFLTECTLKKYATGNYHKGPHIMGFAANETVTFAGSVDNLLEMVDAALLSIKTAVPGVHLPFLKRLRAMTTAAIANLSKSFIYALIKETTDLLFITGIDSKQKLMRLHNDYHIYYYRFSFDSIYSTHRSKGVDLDGVGHGDDLPYIFYRPKDNLPLHQPDIEITRRRFVRMWTNFAKYGNPTPGGESDSDLEITWPNSGIFGRHLEFNRNLSVGDRPTDKEVKAFELTGLGTSRILNDCLFNDVPNRIIRTCT